MFPLDITPLLQRTLKKKISSALNFGPSRRTLNKKLSALVWPILKHFEKNILCRVHSKLLRPSNIIDNCFNLVYLNATLTREPKRCLAYQNSNVAMKRLKKNNGFTWTALISRQLSFHIFLIVFTPVRDGKKMINLYNVKKP